MKKTKFNDLFITQNITHKDQRGHFKELIRENKVNKKFPFLVMSYSKKNIIRGLHLQRKRSQGKFISVIKGKIFDVALDLRKNSKTFGKYYSIIISDKSDFSFFMPQGFAHGFVCLSKTCTVNYKCSNYRHAKTEINLDWQDQDLKIKWPIKKGILSNKDRHGVTFKDLKKML